MRRIVPIALLVLVLAGCTPAPSVPTAAPTVPVAETSTPSPTPVPTQEPETGLVQPAQVFDGDCSSLLSDADASDLLGSPVALSPDTWIDTAEALVWQAGGFTCRWRGADSNYGLTLTAAPSTSVADLDEPLDCAVGNVDSPSLTCGVESSANGIVVTGLAFIGTADSSAAKKKAAAKVGALTERIAENSTESMWSPTPVPAENAWANPGTVATADPPSCVELDAAITSDEFLGDGATRRNPGDGGGGDVYITPIARDLMGYTTHEAWVCAWYVERTKAQVKKGLLTSFSAATVGGGAWVLDLVAQEDGVTEVTIAGADRAYRVEDEYGYVKVWASSGPNLAVAGYTPGSKDANYISLRLVVEALNAA